MESLPDEILSVVFQYLSPYKEHEIAARVCKKWQRIVQDVTVHLPFKFEIALQKGKIEWSQIKDSDFTQVSARTGQSVCYCDFNCFFYVFGGRSALNSMTGFNDLLCLNLHTSTWFRPPAKGTIPPPKYGCCMQAYKNELVLFGGSSLSPSNTLSRGSAEYYNDLHIFNTISGVWTFKTYHPPECPPPLFGASMCVFDNNDSEEDLIIIHGGIKTDKSKNNELWCLLRHDLTWQQHDIIGLPTQLAQVLVGDVQRINIKASSMAMLVLDKSLRSACLLIRTEYDKWTYKETSILPCINEYMPKFSPVPGRPFCIVGNTLIATGHSGDHSILTPYNSLKACDDINSGNLGGLNSPLCVFLLDISQIETMDSLQWVNQLSSSHKLKETFVCDLLFSGIYSVYARGEIILHGVAKCPSPIVNTVNRTQTNKQYAMKLVKVGLNLSL